MFVEKKTITIQQGSLVQWSVWVTDQHGNIVPMSGKKLRMTIRSDGQVVWSVQDVAPSPNHVFGITILPSTTAQFNFNTGVFDIEVYTPDNSNVTRIAEGYVMLSKEVTK